MLSLSLWERKTKKAIKKRGPREANESGDGLFRRSVRGDRSSTVIPR